MPIVFEEVTGEVAPERSASGGDTHAPAPDTADELRDKMLCEMALLHERQARLFAD
ncbi:MAG TPA: hypothetical protein VF901_31170 [Bradyrhizobium sp.]|nr:hypothetical protein [Burkholderiales bacterium]